MAHQLMELLIAECKNLSALRFGRKIHIVGIVMVTFTEQTLRQEHHDSTMAPRLFVTGVEVDVTVPNEPT